jgi:PTH1 family peptidyl-tRNA hydrolase
VKTIVGLGNPGMTYRDTRHNLGFAVIMTLSARHGVQLAHRLVHPADGRPAAVYGEWASPRGPVRLLMPLTMMNESGQALAAAGSQAGELLVVCDDVNLPLGLLRLRPRGSAGGHHGLQSCLQVLGTDRVARLRLGVGVEPLPSDLTGFVLARFASSERPLAARTVERAADACEAWVGEGIDAAMARYNGETAGTC